ncbi:MAG: LapA family protein [Orrella sp.]
MFTVRYLAWTVKLLIFVLVVLFAYKNTAPVEVVLFDGIVWSNVPLIVVMVSAFVLGTLLGALVMLPSTWRRRREAGKLRRDLSKVKAAVATPSPSAKSEATLKASSADSTPL